MKIAYFEREIDDNLGFEEWNENLKRIFYFSFTAKLSTIDIRIQKPI